MNRLARLLSSLPPGRTPVLLSMLHNGEERLGVEMLVENLFDLDVAVTADERACLGGLASDFCIGPNYLLLLEALRLVET